MFVIFLFLFSYTFSSLDDTGQLNVAQGETNLRVQGVLLLVRI